MTDILARKNRPVLERFTQSNLLVAFDFDGTLAPLVERPDRARMRSATRRLLQAVARRYPSIVISGRARADVMRRLAGVPLAHVAGNHGLEPWAEKSWYATEVREWVAQLIRALAGYEGVIVEDKVYSVSVHYRLSPHKRLALGAIEQAGAALRGFRRIGGKDVVNFVPRGAPGKGAALERARRLLACDLALYVGDDDTDEEAFASGTPSRLLSIRVGPVRRSRASYLLENQAQIDRLLQRLVALRARPTASRP